jgi:putative multiple sugar transport system substrate-binding protein
MSSSPTAACSEQQNQIQAMITKQARSSSSAPSTARSWAPRPRRPRDSGAIVIAYDRLLKNTPDVDYYIAYDNRKVGQLQGQALLDGMKAKKPNGPYNIELFAGSPDDANAQVFFDGAMDILKPKIDDGTLKVPSGRPASTRSSRRAGRPRTHRSAWTRSCRPTTPAPPSTACSPRTTPSLGPSSRRSRAAGKPIPIVTGQDSEVESVKSIMAGEQYSTINKDTRALVADTIKMVQALQKGQRSGDQRHQAVQQRCQGRSRPSSCTPVIVTKANAKEAYANDPTLLAIVNAAG